ncbi:hypothetical protein [Poseidonibacter ostreae]|jgi:hypothetical protein|uniref:Uncharacterized protein n=1 Tax=Poseidonibacter ostreae TaxID=2654171 RepID=A0A6L4WRY9_9BACT|nr:hypothetical protein [Poseidonibacter ostreae]KAB7883094.1 hypothetical protein GA417_13105 [Poseidonibacter ostreae]KAB7888197.1 hypothetical protein GBG19_09560 [Poseidonibacter ostreae]KAB7892027.1 hypothetical protein GBG18_04535 [Poseidonibacter ostreae]
MKKNVLVVISLFLLSLNLFGASTNSSDTTGKLYNTAYFDITLKSQGAMLDYIKYSKRASFDTKQFLGTVNKINESEIVINIHGRIEVPSDITSKLVYVNVGPNYIHTYSHSSKYIYYNNSKNNQTAEYFLVDTKNDKFGNRYIDYKIVIKRGSIRDINSSPTLLPSGIKFTVAPKTRGFKDKFQDAEIYVFEE